MATTTYLLTKTPNSSGECQIILRTYIRHDYRLRVQSGIWVNPKRWGKKNNITIPVIEGEEQASLLQKKELLKKLTAFVETAVATASDRSVLDRAWGERQVKAFYKPPKAKREDEKSFFGIIDEYIAKHKLSEQRLKNFKVLTRCLMRFELYKRKTGSRGFKLNLSSLNPDQLRQIDEFLANEKQVFLQFPEIYEEVPYSAKLAVKTPKRKRPPILDEEGNEVPKGMPKERGQNSIADMMNRFRAFILWANDNGYTANNPFKHYSIGEIVYGTPIYISNEERNRLYETDFSDDPALAVQRDIFVFQCYIGCRVSDLYKMTERNIIDGAIEYIPRKTKEDRGITVRVPLTKVALEILARYRDPVRETLLPFYSEQKYNVKIKEAFKRAGLDRMVTTIDQRTRQEVQRPLYEVASSHMARRTFIGNIYKKVKDPNLVGSLSGHKEGSKAFARYRDIDEEMKRELVGLLE